MTIELTHAPRTTPKPSSSPGARLPGLDGLRALAVLAVVTFHLHSTWLPGGFLGVDLFFVISGFLITRLLLAEFADTGRIDLAAFYRRRFRRLVPAVVALIGVVAAACVLVWRDELVTLRGSIVSSLTYSTNWWLITAHQSYFVADGRPPMLQHLWSLAIEEQFYLVWGAVLVLLTGTLAIRRVPATPNRAVIALALTLSAASAVLMATVAIGNDIPYATDSSRVYFGTDTHGFGLLLGSAAGAWSVLRSQPVRRHRRLASPLLADLAGGAGLAALVWLAAHVDEYVPGLYRGGFFAIDALAVIVVLAVTRAGSRLGRLLDIAPLQWIGKRSYSIYLWHWPVVVVTRPGVDVNGPTWLITAARVAIVLALAAASYRFVELPWRARATAQAATPPAGSPTRLLLAAGVAVAASATLLTSCSTRHAADNRYPGPPPATGTATSSAARSATPDRSSTTAPTAEPNPAAHPAAPRPAHGSSAHRGEPRRPTANPTPPTAQPNPAADVASQPAVSMFGDSVLLGTEPALQSLDRRVTVDAVVGRQAYDTLGDVVADAEHGQLAPNVVIHTGDNGVIDPSQLRSTLRLLADRRRVVLIDDRVPRDWQDPNNALLDKTAKSFSNVVLLDWHALSAGHDSWFYDDQIHLNPTGAPHFARMILTAIES